MCTAVVVSAAVKYDKLSKQDFFFLILKINRMVYFVSVPDILSRTICSELNCCLAHLAFGKNRCRAYFLQRAAMNWRHTAYAASVNTNTLTSSRLQISGRCQRLMAGDTEYQQVRQTSVDLCWTFLKRDILKEEVQSGHGKIYLHFADTHELNRTHSC